jgi:tRNA-2-methylthio-N6-dimethylallyladenosine synthase
VGRVETVLVEGPSKNEREEMKGRTRGNGIVNFPGERDLIGRNASVLITEAFLHSLRGEMKEKEGEDVH